MIALIQRVQSAQVSVNEHIIGHIGYGIMLLLGIEKTDTETHAQRLFTRITQYRIFEDEKGKMNHSLLDVNGELLIVPQFTLPADTKKGNRPSFTPAASPELGKTLYDYFVQLRLQQYGSVQTGQFGAHMQVQLINDGPVTFWLQV